LIPDREAVGDPDNPVSSQQLCFESKPGCGPVGKGQVHKVSKAGARQLPEYVKRVSPGTWRLRVWVQPGANQDGLAGVYQGRLKVRLGAPAVDNKANKALTLFLAGLLGIRKSGIRIHKGHASRQKTLLVNCSAEPDWRAFPIQ
jgi:uncharacterized protein (TIGR00251 family)